jgi:nucleotide-binding universal stress UspA family protein
VTLKFILTPIIDLKDDEAALVAAAELTKIADGKAASLIVAVQLASAFAETQRTLSDVLADITAGPNSSSAQTRDRIIKWLERAPHQFEVRDLSVETALNEHAILAHALLSDLVVMTQGGSHARARRGLIEHILFQAGRPMLLVPPQVKERRWRRALIGWNAKPQAMRAISAALPILRQAEEVVVATIDARPSPAGHGEAPGHDLGAYLARHGVTTHVRNVDSLGRTHAAALVDQAGSDQADVMVLGAYGHSRAREFLFGGVTRELLEASPIPIFMAH